MSQLSLDKAKIRFLLLEGVHKNALDVLSNNGYTNIEYLRTALDEDALIAKIKDAHFVGIRSRTQITAKVLEAANKLIAGGVVGAYVVTSFDGDVIKPYISA